MVSYEIGPEFNKTTGRHMGYHGTLQRDGGNCGATAMATEALIAHSAINSQAFSELITAARVALVKDQKHASMKSTSKLKQPLLYLLKCILNAPSLFRN